MAWGIMNLCTSIYMCFASRCQRPEPRNPDQDEERPNRPIPLQPVQPKDGPAQSAQPAQPFQDPRTAGVTMPPYERPPRDTREGKFLTGANEDRPESSGHGSSARRTSRQMDYFNNWKNKMEKKGESRHRLSDEQRARVQQIVSGGQQAAPDQSLPQQAVPAPAQSSNPTRRRSETCRPALPTIRIDQDQADPSRIATSSRPDVAAETTDGFREVPLGWGAPAPVPSVPVSQQNTAGSAPNEAIKPASATGSKTVTKDESTSSDSDDGDGK
ncbi:hypothetical protein AJ79_07127 [Helicocarpus griseus UAMH5409]|uniref:Uncharacterized protein n=1 Tax=Helicocarpus griseus UAMH5409 TaxID=1447875 RepID=A0A2B7X5K7_9EURO|nr:hypothetical protein AJ79_07127 [Helicocarpus griseus UAMH5409]